MRGFLRSFVYAARGMAHGLRSCRNLRIMAILAALAVILGVLLGLDRGEWCAVALACGLVLAVELVNSAGEALADLVQPDQDPRVGRIKDLLAGASLAAALAAAAVGLLVFVPHLTG
ncbi:MAG: diacylglycerol kinase family protein [bacterium]|nr:diacylglycerol kinase family protein [bacterium]